MKNPHTDKCIEKIIRCINSLSFGITGHAMRRIKERCIGRQEFLKDVRKGAGKKIKYSRGCYFVEGRENTYVFKGNANLITVLLPYDQYHNEQPTDGGLPGQIQCVQEICLKSNKRSGVNFISAKKAV